MWKEPLLIVGMVIIATCVVVGMIAVFAKEIALAISAILLTFVGTTLLQAYTAIKASSADKKTDAAVVVAKDAHDETVNLGEKLQQGQVEGKAAIQELEHKINSNMEKALVSAEKSGVAKGLEQARTGNVQA